VTNQETAPSNSASNPLIRARGAYNGVVASVARFQWLALLLARIVVARVFFMSGLTKWNGLTIRDDTYYLFAYEYFGDYNLPEAATNLFAVGAAFAEIILPVLLVLGLFTRASALALLAMTLVIQIFVYPDAWWNVHAWWTAVLVILVAYGAGAASVDRRVGLH